MKPRTLRLAMMKLPLQCLRCRSSDTSRCATPSKRRRWPHPDRAPPAAIIAEPDSAIASGLREPASASGVPGCPSPVSGASSALLAAALQVLHRCSTGALRRRCRLLEPWVCCVLDRINASPFGFWLVLLAAHPL